MPCTSAPPRCLPALKFPDYRAASPHREGPGAALEAEKTNLSAKSWRPGMFGLGKGRLSALFTPEGQKASPPPSRASKREAQPGHRHSVASLQRV